MGTTKGDKTMTFRDQLVELDVCPESLKWVGNKTFGQAWKTCKNSEWMIWILYKTGFDLTDPICNIAEGVLHLVPEDMQLACIWSISAAKRRANKDELTAAKAAADDSIRCAISTSSNSVVDYAAGNAIHAAYCTVSYCTSRTSLTLTDPSLTALGYADDVLTAAAEAVADAAYADAAYADANDFDASFKERKKQCDILRNYFTIDQVKKAFNKLVETSLLVTKI
jgi:hypothetical protein